MEIRVYPDADAVARATANLIAFEIEDGAATLGLAGGSTPQAAYRLLPGYDLDWTATSLWVSDERWVAPEDPESNVHMAHETFVDEVGGRLLAPDYGSGDPETAAQEYTNSLLKAFGASGPGLVLLGIGDDGHTASLFPDSASLDAGGVRFVSNWVAQKDSWRLTATFELLWSARVLAFVVAGASKAPIVAEILNDDAPYPAGRVAAGAKQVIWLLDESAAADLADHHRG